MATKSTKGKRSAKKATKKTTVKATGTNPCLCGCGAKVTRNFAQGHDARLRGMLLRGEIKSPSKEQREFAKSHGVVIGSLKPSAE